MLPHVGGVPVRARCGASNRSFTSYVNPELTACMTCRHDRGELFSVGGVIYQDTFWHIEHITPLAVPGWLVVKPIRHVEHVADLSGDEAIQQFGPLVQLTAAALRATTNAAKGVRGDVR